VRLRRPKTDAAGQRSAIINLASLSLCGSAIASSAVALKPSAVKSTSGTESAVDTKKKFGSRALDYSNVFGTALAPFVEVIPVVGTPLKAAIGGFVGILNIVDVSMKCLQQHPIHNWYALQKMSQNEQAIKDLTSELRDLLDELGNCPEALTPRALQLQRNMISYFIVIFRL